MSLRGTTTIPLHGRLTVLGFVLQSEITQTLKLPKTIPTEMNSACISVPKYCCGTITVYSVAPIVFLCWLFMDICLERTVHSIVQVITHYFSKLNEIRK